MAIVVAMSDMRLSKTERNEEQNKVTHEYLHALMYLTKYATAHVRADALSSDGPSSLRTDVRESATYSGEILDGLLCRDNCLCKETTTPNHLKSEERQFF